MIRQISYPYHYNRCKQCVGNAPTHFGQKRNHEKVSIFSLFSLLKVLEDFLQKWAALGTKCGHFFAKLHQTASNDPFLFAVSVNMGQKTLSGHCPTVAKSEIKSGQMATKVGRNDHPLGTNAHKLFSDLAT